MSKAKKISCGKYEYRGFILINYGYHQPDHCVWWQAIDMKTDCADFHEHTKRDLMEAIDKELDAEGI